MSKSNLTLKGLAFQLGDKVCISELKRPGRIKAIYISEDGIQYNVRYFDDGKAQTVYFYEEELQAEKQSPKRKGK